MKTLWNICKTIGGIIVICISLPILCVLDVKESFQKKTDDEY